MEVEKKSLTSDNKSLIIIGMSTAIVLVSPVIGLMLVGYFSDKFFHTTPIIMTAGILLGFISGIMNVFKIMKLFQKQKQAKPML